jgi:hypothetical protein
MSIMLIVVLHIKSGKGLAVKHHSAHFRRGPRVRFPRNRFRRGCRVRFPRNRFRRGSRVQMKQIESLSWSVPGSLAWFLVPQIRSFALHTVFWSKAIDFPSKTGAILASICYFLVLDCCLQALGPIQSFRPIRLLELIGPWTFVYSRP